MKPAASAKPNEPEVIVRWNPYKKVVGYSKVYFHNRLMKSEFNKTQCFLKFIGIIARITLIDVKRICKKNKRNGGYLH